MRDQNRTMGRMGPWTHTPWLFELSHPSEMVLRGVSYMQHNVSYLLFFGDLYPAQDASDISRYRNTELSEKDVSLKLANQISNIPAWIQIQWKRYNQESHIETTGIVRGRMENKENQSKNLLLLRPQGYQTWQGCLSCQWNYFLSVFLASRVGYCLCPSLYASSMHASGRVESRFQLFEADFDPVCGSEAYSQNKVKSGLQQYMCIIRRKLLWKKGLQKATRRKPKGELWRLLHCFRDS